MKPILPTLKLSLMILSLFGLMSCASSTELVKSWSDPSFEGKSFQKILVLAVIKDDARRRLYEQSFADRVTNAKVTGIAGYTLIEDPKDYGSKPKILEAVKKSGADVVLPGDLVSVKEKERQVPSSFVYAPRFGYGYGFYGYHGRTYDTVYQPGHTTIDTVVKLETTVFDVETEKMVWAGGTRSFNPASAEKVVMENADLILSGMRRSGLLP